MVEADPMAAAEGNCIQFRISGEAGKLHCRPFHFLCLTIHPLWPLRFQVNQYAIQRMFDVAGILAGSPE